MTSEPSRFKVKKGKAEVVEQWMNFLNEHMDKVLLTLNDEKMFVETIFKEEINGAVYLYWYSVQGEGGAELENSEHEVDKKHMEFWNECIDLSYQPVDIEPKVVMIQEKVKDAMK
ncbi:hypothetical protein A1A1_11897 [Planococcus antarcticus DSM 14505]|uniref:Uncharacterized protein n=1 Tax=Planococcus antarcticus DSM 14505 TaxID=1185653 RepID=A0AA87IKI2_9BACL|nr:DUF6176 family protein [Planococcus antarcticus]EIM06264.1 hypothetical protein A1A1_11897 [Planococcus antarcticus DSM 14505]